MKRSLFSIFLPIFTLSFIAAARNPEVLIQDLENLNATCERDSCYKKGEQHFHLGCDCGSFCAQTGTCCLDSSYLSLPPPKIKPKCRYLGKNSWYMIDRCPEIVDSKSAYEDLCQSEWDGENDVMRLVPVTSIATHITYKNYFCFQCHESHDDYMFWDVRMVGDQRQTNVDDEKVSLNVRLVYDKKYGSWMAPIGEGDSSVPVNLEISEPVPIISITKRCSEDVISECPRFFEDEDMKAKCDSYMYLTFIERHELTLIYKNPHCALCNYELLEDKSCPPMVGIGITGAAQRPPFSFTFLLDINRSDGDMVGKIQRCKNNDVWDPFFEKCRTPTCALPGYKVRDGKCVPP